MEKRDAGVREGRKDCSVREQEKSVREKEKSL